MHTDQQELSLNRMTYLVQGCNKIIMDVKYLNMMFGVTLMTEKEESYAFQL